MNVISFLSKLVVVILMIFTVACTNEEGVNNNPKENNKETTPDATFVGGIDIDTKAKSATRTSLDITYPGGFSVKYFWEKGDRIWTADGASGEAQITTKSPTAHFKLTKGYSTSTVDVYYPGQNATTYNQVTIATAQMQSAPNNSAHLGKCGDCGTATAHKQPNGTYKFNLNHKAAYLCLLPRTPNGLVSTYVQQIKVISDNNIAGTYTLTKSGLEGNGSSNTITLTTKTNAQSSEFFYGFPLNNSQTSQSTNAAYVVIAPGTHALTIEYTLYDSKTNVKGIFTKKISSATYSANTVYPMTAKINPTDYPSNVYYMWDAKVGQHYWNGYENYQPKVDDDNNKNYPKDNDDPRWYNEIIGYNPSNSSLPFASRSCAACPNVNELLWYADKGDPHWDTTLWTTLGHLYEGGMWFKKKDYIIGYQADVAPDGVDYRKTVTVADQSYPSITWGRPADITNYFYLPAQGLYFGGTYSSVGAIGAYWSSTPRPKEKMTSYYLGISDSHVRVAGNDRRMGFRPWKAQ